MDYGLIETAARIDIWKRLAIIKSEVEALIQATQPEAVILETVYIGRQSSSNKRKGSNPNMLRQLLAVYTIVGMAAFERDLPIAEVRSERTHNDSWRRRFELSGGEQGKRECKKLFRHFVNASLTEHESDACAIALTGSLNAGYITDREFNYFKSQLNYSLLTDAA